MSQFQVVHFKFTTPNLTKRFLLVQPDYSTLVNKIKTIYPKFKTLEVQDSEGDWIQVENDEEWHYMKLILNLGPEEPFHVRDGAEYALPAKGNDVTLTPDGKTNVSGTSQGNTSTNTTLSASALNSLTGAFNTLGTGALGILTGSQSDSNSSTSNTANNSVLQAAIPSLISFIAKNPQLLTTTLSTLTTLGTQGSSLLQSDLLPTVRALASVASSQKNAQTSSRASKGSSTSNSPQNSKSSISNDSSSKESKQTTSDKSNKSQAIDLASTILLQVLKANNQKLQSSDTSGDSQSSQNSQQTDDQYGAKYQEHVQQGLLLFESLVKKANEAYTSYSNTSNLASSTATSNSPNSEVSTPTIQNSDLSSSTGKMGEKKYVSVSSLQPNAPAPNTSYPQMFPQTTSSHGSIKGKGGDQQGSLPSRTTTQPPFNPNYVNAPKTSADYPPVNLIYPVSTDKQPFESPMNKSNETTPPEYLTNLQLLESMSFNNRDENIEALKQSNNNLNGAVQYLWINQGLMKKP